MTYLSDIKKLVAPSTTLEQQVCMIRNLHAWQDKGEVLAALAKAILQESHCLASVPQETVDLVGTGGDGFHSLNFSTLGALVAAACGIPVAKHGNRSVTSRCGSFDLLQQLGVVIPTDVVKATALLERYGIVFLFAPYFHPTMKRVALARKVFAQRGEKTIFNLLGPLLNPARVNRISMGVYGPQFLMPCAMALQQLGVCYAYVVHGAGLDEMTVTGSTQWVKLADQQITQGELTSASLPWPTAPMSALTGGSPEENLVRSLAILQNQDLGPARQMVVLNAASAIQVSKRFSLSLSDCISMAEEALTSGRVMSLLEQLRE